MCCDDGAFTSIIFSFFGTEQRAVNTYEFPFHRQTTLSSAQTVQCTCSCAVLLHINILMLDFFFVFFLCCFLSAISRNVYVMISKFHVDGISKRTHCEKFSFTGAYANICTYYSNSGDPPTTEMKWKGEMGT